METFKILLVGDQHNSDQNPESRKDDYCEAIFAKMEFIFAYAISKGIRYVGLLGDLFHRKRPNLNSHALVVRLLKLFLKFKADFFDKWGLEATIFTLPGNHDIHFTITNLERQPINVLAAAGAVVILNRTPILLEAGVELNGCPYGEDTETDPAAYHLPFLHQHTWKLWLFHSTLLPDGQSFFGSWVNFNAVADIAANVVAVGHYHPGFPTTEAYNKIWINPGSISRGTAEEHNFNRDLRVVALLRRESGEVVYKDVPIPFRPAEEVFRVEALKEKRARTEGIAAFVSSINEDILAHTDFSSLESLKISLKKLSPETEVVASAIRYLEEAADEVGI
ncbi:metallophosphoesterase [Candidatus Parcubacteria bacterium]|nr:metallophosphoesterase [Candidatus Parcubacteria bacterium]